MPALLTTEIYVVVAIAAAMGGLTRGFTGFGFAMVFMPIASSVLAPKEALATIWVIDAPFALFLGWRALPKADRSGVFSLLLASSIMFPVGLYCLIHLDPVPVRWIISTLIVILVAVLASGWRYHGSPNLALTLGVGSVSGLFGGLASLSGMPLALFWLSSQARRPIDIRADMQSFFGLSTLVSGAILVSNDVMTKEAVMLGLIMMPIYGGMLYAGTHGFRIASEGTFRRVAYTVIFLAAMISLPIFDSVLR